MSFIDIISNYGIIIAWGLILIFILIDLKKPSIFKYEQRVQSADKSLTKEQEQDIINQINDLNKAINKKEKKLKIINWIFIILIVLSSLICIASTIILYFGVTTINSLLFNPLHSWVLFVLSSLLLTLFNQYNKSTKYLKPILSFLAIILILPLYIYYFANQPYFWDLIILVFTLFIFFCFKQTKYKYAVVLILLGINLIMISAKFYNIINLLYNLLFAIGTGILATGICNIFIIIENRKKKKNERMIYLDTMLFALSELMETLYNDLCKKLHCTEAFEYIKYEEFKTKFLKLLNNKRSKVINLLSADTLDNLNFLSKETMDVYKNKKYLMSEGVFKEDELEELYTLYSVPKQIFEKYQQNSNKDVKIKLVLFFEVLHTLSKSIPEVDDLINRFGKEKVFAEYKVGGGIVCPNGTKVNAEEVYKFKQRKP